MCRSGPLSHRRGNDGVERVKKQPRLVQHLGHQLTKREITTTESIKRKVDHPPLVCVEAVLRTVGGPKDTPRSLMLHCCPDCALSQPLLPLQLREGKSRESAREAVLDRELEE